MTDTDALIAQVETERARYAALHAALEAILDKSARAEGYDCLIWPSDLRAVLAAHPAPDDRDNHIRAEHGEAIAAAIEAFVYENHGEEHPEGTCEVCDLFGNVHDLARDTSPPTEDGDTHG